MGAVSYERGNPVGGTVCHDLSVGGVSVCVGCNTTHDENCSPMSPTKVQAGCPADIAIHGVEGSGARVAGTLFRV